MKTTVEIPDALLQRAKVVSAQRNITMRQLIIDGLKRVLDEPVSREPVELTPEQKDYMEIGKLGYPVFRKRDRDEISDEEYLERIEEIRNEIGV